MAGIMRVFLVYPTFAVYPQVMPTVQLFDALHRGQGMMMQTKRKKFFWYIFIGIFVWEWFPVRLLFLPFGSGGLHTNLSGAWAMIGVYCPDSDWDQYLLLGRPEECLGYTHFWSVPAFFISYLLNPSFIGGAAGNEGLGAFSFCFDWAYVSILNVLFR